MVADQNSAASDKEIAYMMLSRILSFNLKSKEYDKLDLTHNQRAVLQRLMIVRDSTTVLTMTDLSNQLEITKSAISQTVSKLERKGLLKRSWAKGDRRRILVNLTAKGNMFADSLFESIVEFIKDKLGRLEEEEKQTFVALFKKCTEIEAAPVAEKE